MSRILCIIAGQRTGTTALRSALASTGKFYNLGEIFHNGDTESRRNGAFLDFARRRQLQLDQITTTQETEKIALEYTEHLSSIAENRFPLIDVKLNSWNVLRPFWTYPHQEPLFMEVLKKMEAYFVFIIRRDLTAQILSEQIARWTGKWHNLTSADLHDHREVSIAPLQQQARLIVQSENLLHSFLKHYGNKFDIAYEDLFDGTEVSRPLISALSQNFNVELPLSVCSHIKKNAGSKKQVVTNYCAVESAIRAVEETCGRPF